MFRKQRCELSGPSRSILSAYLAIELYSSPNAHAISHLATCPRRLQSGIDIIAGNFQQGMKEASTEAIEGTSNIACILHLSQVGPCSLGFSLCGKTWRPDFPLPSQKRNQDILASGQSQTHLEYVLLHHLTLWYVPASWNRTIGFLGIGQLVVLHLRVGAAPRGTS